MKRFSSLSTTIPRVQTTKCPSPAESVFWCSGRWRYIRSALPRNYPATYADVLLPFSFPFSSNDEDHWWQATSLKTQNSGWIPSNYVAPIRSDEKNPWFHGKVGGRRVAMVDLFFSSTATLSFFPSTDLLFHFLICPSSTLALSVDPQDNGRVPS